MRGTDVSRTVAGSRVDEPPPVLSAQDITKSYRGWTALQGLSFSLPAGRVLGFLGPNGAGKTTGIRILTTILPATSGRFSIAGIPSTRPSEIRPLIGVLPETMGLPNQITGTEYLTYFARLYGIGGGDARGHAWSLLDLVGLADRGGSLIRTYSHGMRQRLGIARALVNEPVVLFLDEPTVGLDPRGKRELLGLLRTIAADRGAAVVLSSHALSEVEDACDDVVILSAGRVVATGTVGDVLARALGAHGDGREAVRVQVRPEDTARAAELLRVTDGVAAVSPPTLERRLEIELTTPASTDGGSDRVLAVLLRAGIHVLSFEVVGSRLQDAFIELTEEDHGDAG
jgi:ABC-2 type transport system ATP-binding protein